MKWIRNWPLVLSTVAASALLSNLPVVFAQTKASQRQVVPETTSSSESLERTGGSYYALVIGIANYTNMPKLITPVSDANEVETILRVTYGFKTKLLPDATRDQILKELDRDKHTLSENDSLLIYYAGHGYYDKLENQAYWAPVDAGQDTYARWITATDITSKARAIPARHVLVISDSCYSGMLARDFDPSAVPGDARDPFIIRMLQGKSRDLMSSGGNEPVSDSDVPGRGNHSVFANALIRGLRQMTLSRFSASELFDQYVKVQVPGRSKQMPGYTVIRDSGHEGGDFVFLRKGEGLKLPAAETEGIAPPSLPPNPGKEAIQATLEDYEKAYDSMDTDQMKHVWPSMSREQIKTLRRAFEGAKAVIVELRGPSITLSGDTASVTADQWVKWTRDGHQQPPQADSVEIQLKKMAGGKWLVDGVRGVRGR